MVSDGKLNITTGNDSTASVMTVVAVDFAVGDSLSVDVPPVPGSQSVFLMGSTTAGQPNGTSSFGFRFRRDGSLDRLHLYPGGITASTPDPSRDKPATLKITRTSETDFAYFIAIEGVQTQLGSFTLSQLAGIHSLHIGAQAWDLASHVYSFDNLQVSRLGILSRLDGANLNGDDAIDLNDLLEFAEWWLAGR